MNINLQEARCLAWAEAKGIVDKENKFKQFCKMTEETGEIASALFRDDQEKLKDAIGDQFVTAAILAAQNKLDMQDCIETALQVIEKRKTITIDGKVLKLEEVNGK